MEQVLPRTDYRVPPQKRLLYGIAGGALVAFGLRRRSVLATLIGSDFIVRGATGHHLHEFLGLVDHTGPHGATRIPHQIGVQVERSIVVNTTPQEAYSFVRDIENLPRFVKHVKSVTVMKGNRWHWVVRGPKGQEFEWDSEIISDAPGHLISWRSLDHPDIKSAGSVHFEPAPGNRGTIIRVRMQYLPIGGALGAMVLKLFGEDPDWQLADDLRRLKQLLEMGEIATTDGQPVGGRRGVRLETRTENAAPTRLPEQRRRAAWA